MYVVKNEESWVLFTKSNYLLNRALLNRTLLNRALLNRGLGIPMSTKLLFLRFLTVSDQTHKATVATTA